LRDPHEATRAGFPRALAAAVLAVVLAAGAWAFNPGPHWKVAAAQHAHGNVLVDDEAIPADDAESFEDALVPGAAIEWNGDGDLVLLSRGRLALAIAPGTRMTLPAPPPRWFLRHGAGRLETGTIRLLSGPRFHGARVTIRTPDAVVEMTGRPLAVIRDSSGTSVCVLDGSVPPPLREETRNAERVALGAFRTAVQGELSKGGD
jgi:hypothetical protein